MGALLYKSTSYETRVWEIKKHLFFTKTLTRVLVHKRFNKVIKIEAYDDVWLTNSIKNIVKKSSGTSNILLNTETLFLTSKEIINFLSTQSVIKLNDVSKPSAITDSLFAKSPEFPYFNTKGVLNFTGRDCINDEHLFINAFPGKNYSNDISIKVKDYVTTPIKFLDNVTGDVKIADAVIKKALLSETSILTLFNFIANSNLYLLK